MAGLKSQPSYVLKVYIPSMYDINEEGVQLVFKLHHYNRKNTSQGHKSYNVTIYKYILSFISDRISMEKNIIILDLCGTTYYKIK